MNKLLKYCLTIPFAIFMNNFGYCIGDGTRNNNSSTSFSPNTPTNVNRSYQSNTNSSSNTVQTNHTTVTIEQTQLLGNLSLSQNLFISSKNITDAIQYNKDMTLSIGTFCTYTNDPKKRMAVIVTTSAGGYYLQSTENQNLVPYTLYINNQKTPYDTHYEFNPNGGEDHTRCSGGNSEKISLNVPSQFLKKASAGVYNIHITLTVSNIK